MSFNINGLNEFRQSLGNSIKIINGDMQKSINKVGKSGLRKVKLKTPVDTGVLRRSWIGKAGDLEYTIKNSVEYAPHIEYGHRIGETNKVVEGQYMLTKAMKELEIDFMKELEYVIENLWED